MTYLLQGLFLGGTYALIAIGVVTIFSVVRAFQLAQGALVTFAAYIFLMAYQGLGHSVVIAIVLVAAALLALSLAISRIAFEPLLGRHFPSLIASLGIGAILEAVVSLYFYQGQSLPYPDSLKASGSVNIFGTSTPINSLVVFGVAILCLILLDRFFSKVRLGMKMRAVADNPVGAMLCGINFTAVVRAGFLVAGLAAAVAGVLLGLLYSTISPTMGDPLLVTALAATLLGGSTSFRGAVLASFIIAISQTLAIGYLNSSFSGVIAYLVIIGVLLLRPQGLFGQPAQIRA